MKPELLQKRLFRQQELPDTAPRTEGRMENKKGSLHWNLRRQGTALLLPPPCPSSRGKPTVFPRYSPQGQGAGQGTCSQGEGVLSTFLQLQLPTPFLARVALSTPAGLRDHSRQQEHPPRAKGHDWLHSLQSFPGKGTDGTTNSGEGRDTTPQEAHKQWRR